MFLVAMALAQAAVPAERVPFVGVRPFDWRSYPLCADNPPAEKICTYVEDGAITFDLRRGRPKWIKMNTLLMLEGGLPWAASIHTIGVDGQDDAYKYLRTTYGNPKYFSVKEVQNRFGAKFAIIHAEWTLKDGAMVVFDGAEDSLDDGVVQWFAKG